LDRGRHGQQRESIKEKEPLKMFESLEDMTRFGESARRVTLKSMARLTVAASIAAIWIEGFFYAFLPAE
jgi:hypothetical protein